MGSQIFQAKLLSLQRNLLSFAYTLTNNKEDDYDLLQDTTLKVLDNEEKYVDNVNFKGWVFTIMRNLFINNYRTMVRSAVVVDKSEDLYQLNMSQESGYETPEGAIATSEIQQALNNLPTELNQCFAMFVAGYKYQEIAQRYDLPLGTVKSRIFLARKRLQKELKDLRYD